MTDPQFPDPRPNVPPVPRAPENNEAAAAFASPQASGVPLPPPAPGYAASQMPQSPATGFAVPAVPYVAPPGAYSVPVGGYASPAQAYQPTTRTPGPRGLGVLSFLLALIAAVATPILAGFAGFEIGLGVPGSATQIMANPESLAFLSPVREQVLWAEVAFWTGTALGVVSLITGIIAIARRRGRGFGIFGVVISVLAPVIFFTVLSVALTVGVSAAYSAM